MKAPKRPRELRAAELRWTCDPRSLGFRTTSELGSADEIVGQARALAAMRLGLEFHSPGYNVFVTGLTGTGKTTAVKRLLDDLRLPGGKPPDLCYVHNFRQPDAPLALQLPAGRGRVFAKDMHDLVLHLRRALPALFESDPYKQARRRLETELQTRVRHLFEAFEKRVAAQGFKIVQVPMGPVQRTEIVPVVDAKPVPFEELRSQAVDDTK